MYFPQDDYYIFTDDYYQFLRPITGAFATAPIGTIILSASTVLSSVTDNENSDFPISNARIITDPFLEYLTDDTTETIIEIVFLDLIDTFFLGNINFTSFSITSDTTEAFAAFKNVDTERYNGISFFNTAGFNSLTITIPNQATTNGVAYFSIGALFGGARTIFQPRYDSTKNIIEPINILRFDENNKEVNNTGRTYHVFNLNFSNITGATFDQIKTVENAIGRDGVALVYENYNDREVGIICERINALPYSESSVDLFQNIMSFKEKVWRYYMI